jgi:hypothetical protein
VGSLDGRTLGHFRIERMIGRGGMGAVYEAIDEKLERQVALKVLLHEGDSAQNRKRFLREARLAAKLTHPNIATVFEVGEFESNLYIVMEMLEGQSLRKLLVDRISTDDALGIARDIARALARAHAAGVTHRDIKPENVFLTTPAPNVLHAKVLDFGLARQQSAKPPPKPNEESTSTGATAPGDLLGTPGYWSPEQARGGEVDVRTDIFSFGLVLYEMITGRRAFKANATVALVLAVTRHEPEPMRKLVPNIDPAIEEVVARCIAKDPAQRYADGSALLAAVESLARESGRASQPDLGGASVRLSRPKLPEAPESAAAATPAATIVDARAATPPTPAERMRLFVAIGAGVALAGLLLIFATLVLGGAPKVQALPVAPPSASVALPEPPVAPSIEARPAAIDPAPSAEPAPLPAAMPFAGPAVSMIPTPLAVPVTSSPVATPSARPRLDKKTDCAQPFTIDAKGVKIPKLHCL